MPNSQYPSLLHTPDLKQSPYAEWLNFTSDTKSFLELAKMFCGLPKSWIIWAEKQTQTNISRGIQINNPLAYRLTCLWNGIILLQEAKYICDIIENAFRQSLSDYSSRHGVTYTDLSVSVPNWSNLLQSFEREQGNPVSLSDQVSLDFFTHLSFYELTETINRNWRKITHTPNDINGYASLFGSDRRCRDSNRFRLEMKQVRISRNDIAHSRKLFLAHEVQGLYAIANFWLTPLNVEIRNRVLGYRDKRPKFLQDLQV